MNIIFLSHWFPPYNEIGAVRPYELVRFLIDQGHRVKVVTSSGNWSQKNYETNMDGIEIARVPIPAIVKFAESSPTALLKRVAKRLFYPDQYVLMKNEIVSRSISLSRDGVDLIISSGLPFSIHVAAKELAGKLDVPWIADNRDLWADTPYRRSFFGSQHLDIAYERYILGSSSACMAIGAGMAGELKKRLPEKRIEVLMNGADCDPLERHFSDYRSRRIAFSYTGTLYKGRRDLSPLLESLSSLGLNASVDFYGSEPRYVDLMAQRYPDVQVNNCGRVGKGDVKKIQQESGFLILALGNDAFEKTVLTGKFFEYLESCRPIIAICDESGDLGRIVNGYSVGCASRDSNVISNFIRTVVENNSWVGRVPEELTRKHQMKTVLERLIDTVRERK